MKSLFSYNQVTVDLDALRANYRFVQQRVGPGVQIMAMVKADAYGHGMVEAALAFAEVGCRHFAVAELFEGVCLRQAGVDGLILVQLGCDSSEIQHLFDYDLTPVVFDTEALQVLSRAALAKCRELAIHLKIDSGMGRLGVLPHEVEAYAARIAELPGLRLTGLMSHFPLADDVCSNQTREQFHQYVSACSRITSDETVLRHIANSGGLLYFNETCGALVRPGLSLYGYYPDGEQGRQREQGEQLRPAMRLETRVIQVKTVAAGTGISYAHQFVTTRKTRLAVLPIGYANGFLRSLTGQAQVLICGQRVPIVGRICMNLCMADITDCPDVAVGDTVVVMGSQGDQLILADEIADWMGTISYEVLCLFGNNNERRYVNRLEEKG